MGHEMRKTIDDVMKKLEDRYNVKSESHKLNDFFEYVFKIHPEYKNGSRNVKDASFDVISMNELANKAMLFLYMTGQAEFRCANNKTKRIGRKCNGKLKRKEDRINDLPLLSQKSIGMIYYRNNGNIIYECKPKDQRLYKLATYLKRHGGWAHNIDEIAGYKEVIEYFGRKIVFKKDVDLRFVKK